MQNDDFLDKDSFYSEGGFQITNRAKSFLATAASWGKFLAIMGFIGTAFMVLAGLGMMFMGSFISGISQNPAFGALGGVGFGAMYILLALFYFFPSLFLFNFSSKTKAAIRNSDNSTLEEAFKNLKSVFMFIGIATIVFIAIYIIVLLGIMLVGATT